MTIYTTDFSEYTTGVNLSDWSDFWSAGGSTYQAASNSGTYKVGSKCCEFAQTASSRKVITWDDIGSVADSDIIVKINITDSLGSSDGARVFSRVGGSSSSEDGYFFSINNSQVKINKYVAGVSTAIALKTFEYNVGDSYYFRCQTTGTTLRCKIWAENAVEPYDWLISQTDTSLSSGYVGFGGYSSGEDFSIDYFSCGVGVDSSVFPPSNISSALNKFGYVGKAATSATSNNLCRAMGGQFSTSDKYLTGISIKHSGSSTTIRAAVYSGGSLSNPNGATLLHDFGEISVTTSPTEASCTAVEIPNDTPIWLIIKYASFGLTYSAVNAYANAGNYQVENGRADLTSSLGYDTSVAFDSTLSTSTPTFSANWYPWDITISATSTETGDLDAEFPALEITATGSDYLLSGDALFPAMEITATGISEFNELDADLPAMEITATGFLFEITCDAELPAMEITAVGSGETTLDVWLPTISLYTPEYFVGGYLDARLPQLNIEAIEDSNDKISIDPREEYWPTLPDLRLEAEFGARLSLDVELPVLEVEGAFGAHLAEDLPAITLAATCLPGQVGSLDAFLPVMEIEARTGFRADRLRLPFMSIEAEASTPVIARLDKKLPSIEIEAAITGACATLDKVIAFPQITATGSRANTGTLDKSIPGIKITAAGLSGAIGSVDVSLPDLQIAAQSNSVVIFLDAYLPPLVSGYASGMAGGNPGSTMSSDRFDNTLLRYERWA